MEVIFYLWRCAIDFISHPVVIGFISGVSGTVFAPWWLWYIERKKLKLAARREMIANARQAIQATNESRAGLVEYRRSITYCQIRQYLSQETIDSVENNFEYPEIEKFNESNRIGMFGVKLSFKIRILCDLSSLEKEWDLI